MIRLIFKKKRPSNLDEMKKYISKQIDRTKSQRCCNVMKTHRTKLREEVIDKNGLNMH